MAGIQLRLQKELFTPSNEQLLSMVHCIKVASEKDRSKTKDIYLCVVNETDRFSRHNQFNINVVEVKGSEKRGDLPKRKRNWTLHELRHIDGKHNSEAKSDADNLFPGDFDLGFGDKVCLNHRFFSEKPTCNGLFSVVFIQSGQL